MTEEYAIFALSRDTAVGVSRKVPFAFRFPSDWRGVKVGGLNAVSARIIS
jgi:hypothetical protein